MKEQEEESPLVISLREHFAKYYPNNVDSSLVREVLAEAEEPDPGDFEPEDPAELEWLKRKEREGDERESK